jgi:hypothetical protein
MSTFTTAQDIGKLQTDLTSAKMELGMLSVESENARTLLLLERVVGLLECLDQRTRESEHKLKRLEGDHK